MFEIISVDLYKGHFVAEKVEAADPVSAMVKYFNDDDPELPIYVEKNLKQCAEGWYMKTEEETFIIRQC